MICPKSSEVDQFLHLATTLTDRYLFWLIGSHYRWGVLVLLKFSCFPVAHQQTCRPRDKNYMILQWKVYLKWMSTFCENNWWGARANKSSAHPFIKPFCPGCLKLAQGAGCRVVWTWCRAPGAGLRVLGAGCCLEFNGTSWLFVTITCQ